MKKLSKFQKQNLNTFLIGLILPIIAFIFIAFSFSKNYLSNFSYRFLKHFSSNLGTFCEILFLIVISLWCIRLILKYINPKTFNFIWNLIDKTKFRLSKTSKDFISSFLTNELKKFLIYISKIVQKLHIPLSAIGFAVISIHVYIFIHLGFKWNLGYILGALAAIVLLILFISGILRIFNKGFKTHKYLGISFIILTLLHILFI